MVQDAHLVRAVGFAEDGPEHRVENHVRQHRLTGAQPPTRGLVAHPRHRGAELLDDAESVVQSTRERHHSPDLLSLKQAELVVELVALRLTNDLPRQQSPFEVGTGAFQISDNLEQVSSTLLGFGDLRNTRDGRIQRRAHALERLACILRPLRHLLSFSPLSHLLFHRRSNTNHAHIFKEEETVKKKKMSWVVQTEERLWDPSEPRSERDEKADEDFRSHVVAELKLIARSFEIRGDCWNVRLGSSDARFVCNSGERITEMDRLLAQYGGKIEDLPDGQGRQITLPIARARDSTPVLEWIKMLMAVLVGASLTWGIRMLMDDPRVQRWFRSQFS